MCLGRVWCSDPMPIGTQKAPSARTVGEFGQSLGFLHVSHLPVLYIQVLAVQHLLHTRPPGGLGVCEVLRSDAYRHSEITHWANYIGGFGQLLASPDVLHLPALYT